MYKQFNDVCDVSDPHWARVKREEHWDVYGLDEDKLEYSRPAY